MILNEFGQKNKIEISNQEIQNEDATGRAEIPWPKPQFNVPYGAVYGIDDVIHCLAGNLDDPKNSGRRVGIAIETEIAMKQSSIAGGAKIPLPLLDRSLGLHYDWFR